jgi:NTP pyrophosphatase (non-canonical NTP hydrolase)
MPNMNDWRDAVYTTALNHGWWDDENPNIPEKIALMHSELSEALEEYRNGDSPTGFRLSNTGKPEGFSVELADVIIRVLDLCGHYGIDIEQVLEKKHTYNLTRPHRHGGKKC